MKYSHKLSDAVHVLSYVEIYKDGDLSSNAIADSIESNPSLVRRLMSSLVQGGLLETRPGSVSPKLTWPTNQITLLDIYNAIEIDHNFLHVDEKTNPACVVGGNIQDALNDVYAKVQQDAEASMQQVKLSSIIDDILIRNANK
ncbi:Rrf2 family transcriptional regulator [Paucilactobacillus nenjiangensis]|uniref:Rrf2 family transcriptional regulator n=1 Tax=Paucilactobacillus nenjiangensis TaxID=1296540 RepID=A0A5P1X2N6_9LACO|nr:Rrf2 family transcriptional regulator [Paucilactobacillus nenjiangensis]QER66598.1 Rrf2 family transcriptional regulator [Paucilactobacillus nenjiangensis]